MQGNFKTWTVVGALALALVFGGAYAFTSSAPWGRGFGGMGIGRMGSSGMMGGGCPGPWWSYGQQARGPVTSLDQAIEIAQSYLASLGNPDLALAELMQFSNNFYGIAKERSTGIGAFEFLIDPATGALYPEPGPNMMWNTKYGHMSGWGPMGRMMGSFTFGEPTAEMPVGPEQAKVYAQKFLDSYMPGLTVSGDVDTFYGYYTIHVLQNGQIYGMLSVNGYTGRVWYHNWHGQFLGMREF